MAGRNPKIYRVKGKFLMGDKMQPFTKELVSMKPEDAQEKIYSDIGSKHKIKRNKIVIESLEEIPEGEATDLMVKYLAGE